MPLPTSAAARRWGRRAGIAVAAVLLLWLIAWLALPPLLKWQGESRLGEWLGRRVTIGAVAFKPWSLELTLDRLEIGAPPDGAQPLLQVARIHANADAASLWRFAPVLSSLEVDGLRLQVARTAPGRYDVDDLIARLAPAPDAPPEVPPSEPARFALYNVQLRDAAARFDDRPEGVVHRIEALQLGLPFLSNLPSDVEVTVEPKLAFRLNGAAFDSDAQALPFAPTRAGELKLGWRDLDLAPYLGYLPETLPVRLQRGVVSADLALRFVVPDGAEPTLVLSGQAGVRELAIADAQGAPLFGWRALQLDLRDVQPLARRLAFGTLRVEGAELNLARAADGQLVLPGPAGGGEASAAAPAQAWQLTLDQLDLADARLRWRDASTRPAASLQLDGIALQARELQWPMQATLPFTLAATLHAGDEAAAPAGRLQAEGRAGENEAGAALQIDELSLAALAPYVAQALVPRLDGRAALKGRVDWSGDDKAPRLALTLDEATLDGVALREGEGRAAATLAGFRQLALADVQVDVAARALRLGRVALSQPTLALAREREGRWNLQRWVAAGGTPAPAAGAAAPPWTVQLGELALDGGRLQFSDAAVAGDAAQPPLRVDATALRLKVQGLTWPGARDTPAARVQFGARVGAPRASAGPGGAGSVGSVAWTGRVRAEPLRVTGTLDVQRFPAHLFEPYAGAALPVSVLHAEAAARGTFTLAAARQGWRVDAQGDASLADVRVHTRAGQVADGATPGDELLSWQSLSAEGIRFTMPPDAPPELELRELALDDFFARLVVTEQGRFNLTGLAPPAAAASAAASPAASAAAAAPEAASAPAPEGAASVPAAGPALPIALSVGGVDLRNGRIDFSDRFVQPNYSADLTGLNGRLGAFRSGSREMATLALRGRAAGTALLEVNGALNPTADPLALDIQAKATDLELAPLSPYAGKYAGYAIERGKLSLEVAYRVAPDGRLEARNQLILNQLSFGDKVDSPDATRLPVRLAVALLKDRHGVIDIDLPISGSINDPQFSVFGIVLKLIGNLLAKALTAPFALLAGGGSADLSLVEFHPGTAILTEAGRGRLEKVAKALADRPALKMTVTGAADAAGEREALLGVALDAQLLAQARREMLRGGAAPAEVDALATLDAATRSRALRELYRRTDLPDKPRNALGFARDIPEAQMEALLKARIPAGEEAMRELALQRGLAVRDALIAQGLAGERLFVAAPKLRAAGEGEGPWTPRAQLSLAVD